MKNLILLALVGLMLFAGCDSVVTPPAPSAEKPGNVTNEPPDRLRWSSNPETCFVKVRRWKDFSSWTKCLSGLEYINMKNEIYFSMQTPLSGPLDQRIVEMFFAPKEQDFVVEKTQDLRKIEFSSDARYTLYLTDDAPQHVVDSYMRFIEPFMSLAVTNMSTERKLSGYPRITTNQNQ